MLGSAIGLDEKSGKLEMLDDAFLLPSGWKIYDFDVDPLHLSPKEFEKPDLTKGQWLHISSILLVNAAGITIRIDLMKDKNGRWDMLRLEHSIAVAIARAGT